MKTAEDKNHLENVRKVSLRRSGQGRRSRDSSVGFHSSVCPHIGQGQNQSVRLCLRQDTHNLPPIHPPRGCMSETQDLSLHLAGTFFLLRSMVFILSTRVTLKISHDASDRSSRLGLCNTLLCAPTGYSVSMLFYMTATGHVWLLTTSNGASTTQFMIIFHFN